MFPNKLQVYLRKPSVFRLRRIIQPQIAQRMLESRVKTGALVRAAPHNPVFEGANEMVQRQAEKQIINYQNSVLWSSTFTPRHFFLNALLPFGFIIAYIFYIHFIAQPQILLQMKFRYRITLPNEKRLEKWLDEYHPKDKVLDIEAVTLEDLQVLYEEGLVSGGTPRQLKMQKIKAIKRMDKFNNERLTAFDKKDFQKI